MIGKPELPSAERAEHDRREGVDSRRAGLWRILSGRWFGGRRIGQTAQLVARATIAEAERDLLEAAARRDLARLEARCDGCDVDCPSCPLDRVSELAGTLADLDVARCRRQGKI